MSHTLLPNIQLTIQRNIKSYTMIIALLAIWLLFTSLTGGIFLSARNLSNLFRQMNIIGMLAIGMVLVIVTGNIDLSVGSVTGFISALVAFLQVSIFPYMLPSLFPQMAQNTIAIVSTILTIIAGILAGVLVGVWQGTLVSRFNIPAFIVTLGGMLIFRGGALGVTQGKTIAPLERPLELIAQGYVLPSVGIILGILVILLIFVSFLLTRRNQIRVGFTPEPFPKTIAKVIFFSALVAVYVLIMNRYRGIQNPVLILAITAAALFYISTNSRFGRYCYAIGGNREAAQLSGINIRKVTFKVFVLMGTLSGFAGIILTGAVGAGTPSSGTSYELDTIAACVIGGTSLMGGEGSIFGAIVGALIMTSLTNGMTLMNMDVFWQYVIKGLVLILAVYVDVLSKKVKR